MLREPENKSAVSFFDGQNLFHHAKAAFGHNHPNFDPQKLSDAVCRANGWTNRGVRFYTGIPTAERSPMWHGYWNNRLLAMKRSGIVVTSRTLHYRTESVELSDGCSQDVYVAREKGIDLRLGLDAVRLPRPWTRIRPPLLCRECLWFSKHISRHTHLGPKNKTRRLPMEGPPGTSCRHLCIRMA